MGRFRKRPVIIDAIPWDGSPSALSAIEAIATGGRPVVREGDELAIVTLEGVMRASLGDYIIRGIQGELYPCKPDIFAATYESA